ncbi:MAG: type II toxin-antitoxin system HicB family antitoxin [Patescibacteria group bacterium]
MKYRFTTVINQDGKWFVARCIELGVVSQGKTIEDAQRNLQEAVELFLEDTPKAKRYLSRMAPLVTTLEVNHA